MKVILCGDLLLTPSTKKNQRPTTEKTRTAGDGGVLGESWRVCSPTWQWVSTGDPGGHLKRNRFLKKGHVNLQGFGGKAFDSQPH